MTVKRVKIEFAVTAEEEPMAIVRNDESYELLSVWSGKDASDLYYSIIRRDMRIDYNELRAVRPSEESST